MTEGKTLLMSEENHRKLFDIKMDRNLKRLDDSLTFLFKESEGTREKVVKFLELLKQKNEEIKQLKISTPINN